MKVDRSSIVPRRGFTDGPGGGGPEWAPEPRRRPGGSLGGSRGAPGRLPEESRVGSRRGPGGVLGAWEAPGAPKAVTKRILKKK